MDKHVTIFLEPEMKTSAAAGEHNFVGKVEAVLRGGGYAVSYADEATRDEPFEGHALVHMKAPMNAHTLVMRRAYAYPFWAIEASDKRWEFDVAKTRFNPEIVKITKAQRFVRNKRNKMFPDAVTSREGFVYIPLQGHISEQRSFQAASPLAMIEAVLKHDSERKIVIGLHPKESYSNSDLAALEAIEKAHERVQIAMGEMETYLPKCDYVVTQNSSAAFFGYFFHKPAVLFGKIDFHHIAANVHELGAEEALRQAPDMTPEFERYIWWFWQEQMINAGRPEAEAQIADRFRKQGWF
ncbi:hypothetical protein KO498_00880 [Lentibacter algarum]|uniref:hypothetical protein n=1 Tax=Lentibacter algarum TaxID=576131 RepID=UPI001C06A716|nr:hypothetical protein [Lentibacter algarum]MBU2980352.1 hypothetical protein [Lentibacter algarum]